MPLYEYRCTQCNTTVDVRHGFDETYTEPCAACGGAVTRSFNVAGIVFKGSGFYINDSRGTTSSTSPGTSTTPAAAPAASTPAPASAPAAPAATPSSTSSSSTT